jgi:hypothetical protein
MDKPVCLVEGCEAQSRTRGFCSKHYHKLCVTHAANPSTKRLIHDPTYQIWAGMKQRCGDVKCKSYRHYGAKGIRVEWQSYEEFLRDMGPRPMKGYSIDRIDNSKNYAPGNCRWVLLEEQNRNKSNVVLHEINGVTYTLRQFALMNGMKYTTVYERVKRGMSLVDAVQNKGRAQCL